ncbi:MAG: oligoendopeptidase F [bacterium]|nr:oligoendopeptidase F [bacterium]
MHHLKSDINDIFRAGLALAMEVAAPAKSGGVRQRGEIAEKYKWQLEHIYTSADEWRGDLVKVKDMLPKVATFQNRLASSGQVLFECFDHRDTASILFYKLYIYAHLKLDEDNRNSQYQAMTDEIAALSTVFAEAGSFITPEIMAIDDDRLEQMKSECPQLRLYDHHLDEMRRMKDHILSPEEERILALVGNVSRGPSQIFRMIDDADIKFGDVTDEKGEKVAMTKQRYYDLLESKDRRVRKESMEVFVSAYKGFVNTLGATLSTSVYKDLFYAKTRQYNTCLESALDADNIPEETYRNLVTTVDAHVGVLHRYAALRKKVLGVDELRPYDMYVPLVPDAKIKISYDDAVRRILEGLWPLGKDYLADLKTAFESGWVDVYESEGKGSGAYSWSTYATHPYVLMNYNDTLDNMFTLAHEMGHAMHSHYSKKFQPYIYSGHSIFTAEVASTTNEELLMHYMLDRVETKEQKAYLLSYYIQQIVGTFFTQVMYSQFEYEIHKDVEEGKPLSADVLRQTFRKIYQKFWGPEMILEEYSDISCLRIPHFYRAFYVYQYATSYSAATMIAERLLKGDEQQRVAYLKFLQSGESKYPIETLQEAGVDLTKSDAIEATARLFGRLVDELEALLVK